MQNTSMSPDLIPHAYLPPSLPYEKTFNTRPPQEWMAKYWWTSGICVVAYLITIFGIQHLMRNRPPFRLQRALEVWNWSLAVFSLVGIVKVVPYALFILQQHGFRSSICLSYHDEEFMKPSVFWMYLFAYSKVVELGDTLFIVLRKRPLIFLHWYHHVTVLVYTWYSFSDSSPSGLWFIAMNYSVHGFMYTYFSLRSMSYRIPRAIAMTLTGLQILQMILGCYINYYAYTFRQADSGCAVSRENIIASTVMYGSYWALFCRFFYNAYVNPRRDRKPAAVPAPPPHKNGYTNGHIKNGFHKNGYKQPNGNANGTARANGTANGSANGHANGALHFRNKESKNGLNRFVPLLEELGVPQKDAQKLE